MMDAVITQGEIIQALAAGVAGVVAFVLHIRLMRRFLRADGFDDRLFWQGMACYGLSLAAVICGMSSLILAA